MNNIYDVLEICLQELENGADSETVLARYPDLASELRPILKASVMARTMSVPAPSQDVVRRGRAKFLQHAAQMREAKIAPRKRMIPIFQRLAITFTMTALFLSSGTGLVGASSSALPGEKLYPVKLTWENVRLFFTFNSENREVLESIFENERLHEVNELLVEGRNETVQYVGVYMEANGTTYVSGIHIVILDTSTLPAEPLVNGAPVVVTGHTNAQGFVDVESIELLPAGSIVPPGEPVETEENRNDNGGHNNINVNESSDVNSNDMTTNDNDGTSNNDNVSIDDANSNDTNSNDTGNINTNNANDDSNGDNSGSGGGGNDSGGGDSGDGGGDSGGGGGSSGGGGD